MNPRPLPVTVVACVFLLAGVVGLVYHLREFAAPAPASFDLVLVSLVRLVAVLCGVYMLRGRNWSRWLAVAWLAFHVGVSAFHSLGELGMHALLLVACAYVLWRPEARTYFRTAT